VHKHGHMYTLLIREKVYIYILLSLLEMKKKSLPILNFFSHSSVGSASEFVDQMRPMTNINGTFHLFVYLPNSQMVSNSRVAYKGRVLIRHYDQ
jgi:hypothetical protein